MNKKKKKTEQRKNETKNSVRSVSYGTSDQDGITMCREGEYKQKKEKAK